MLSKSQLNTLQVFLIRFTILLSFAWSVAAKGGGGRGGSSGGSRGSSSGSRYSSGGYYHGGRYHSSGGGGECDSTCGTILGVIFGSLAAGCCCFFVGIPLMKVQTFNREIEKAEKEVFQDAINAKSNSNKPIISFTKGSFKASYFDSTHENGGSPQSSSGTLNFRKLSSNTAPNVRNIHGDGSDSDGSFSIPRGAVSVWTGKVYWVEQAPGNGIRSLVKGRFSREPLSNTAKFMGEFKCSNNAEGKFTSFILTHNDIEKGTDMEINLVSAAAASVIGQQQQSSPPPPYAGTTISTTTTSSAVSGVPSIFAAPGQEVTLAPAPAYAPPPASVPPSYQPVVPVATATPYQPASTVVSTNYQPTANAYTYNPQPMAPASSQTVPSIFQAPR